MPSVNAVEVRPFGRLNDSRETKLYTLRNANGIEASITDYGATLVSFLAPDRNGNVADIVLGYDKQQDYIDSAAYLGATVGRFANRIADGRFELNGKAYTLDTNCGPNHLHGGQSGFDSRIWHSEILHTSEPSLRFSLFSPDGDQGYPGNLTAHTTYCLNDLNQLVIKMTATCDADTPISMTNHSYFNLAGSGSIEDHYLKLNCEHYTPLNQNHIPSGELASVANTPFDFRHARKVGEQIDSDHEQLKIGSGYDHNFVTPAYQSGQLALVAELEEKVSGRVLSVSTNAPGLQLYTANFLDGRVGKQVKHESRHAVCLEPQHIPDAPNNAAFPSCILKPGEQYEHTIIFACSVA